MFSCELWETVKNTIFTEHLETPASVFMERIWWFFQPFETPINTCEKSKSSDSVIL